MPFDLGGFTAKAEAASAGYSYTVNGDQVTFKNGFYYNVKKGKTKKIKLSNGSNISWSSSNTKVATINSKGVVTAKRPGTTIITATRTTTGSYSTCQVSVYAKRTQKQAYKAIIGLKGDYYEGRYWTNASSYYWETARMSCSGCAAFAAIASDAAFGKTAPVKTHYSFDKIKVGDIIRIGNYHSVVVLKKKSSSIIVAEGNFNNSIHWGREIPYSELASEGFYVTTRY